MYRYMIKDGSSIQATRICIALRSREYDARRECHDGKVAIITDARPDEVAFFDREEAAEFVRREW